VDTRTRTQVLADELLAMLDAFNDVNEMLDAWASAGPEGMTPAERKRQRTAERVAERARNILDEGRD
jgi:hypothetical protein